MKQKDLMYLLLAVGILLVAGYLGYTQLVPKSSSHSSAVTVETVGTIPAEIDSAGLTSIGDGTKVVDFNFPPDLTGLNNQAPFGQ